MAQIPFFGSPIASKASSVQVAASPRRITVLSSRNDHSRCFALSTSPLVATSLTTTKPCKSRWASHAAESATAKRGTLEVSYAGGSMCPNSACQAASRLACSSATRRMRSWSSAAQQRLRRVTSTFRRSAPVNKVAPITAHVRKLEPTKAHAASTAATAINHALCMAMARARATLSFCERVASPPGLNSAPGKSAASLWAPVSQ
jgi:hypothetical protein